MSISISSVSRGRKTFVLHHLATNTSYPVPNLAYTCERIGLSVAHVYRNTSKYEGEVVQFGAWGVSWNHLHGLDKFLEGTKEPLNRADRLYSVRVSGEKTPRLELSLMKEMDGK